MLFSNLPPARMGIRLVLAITGLFLLLCAARLSAAELPAGRAVAHAALDRLCQVLEADVRTWDRHTVPRPQLVFIRDANPNAAVQRGEPTVIYVTTGMLSALRARRPYPAWRDALAFVLGHELAHAQLLHQPSCEVRSSSVDPMAWWDCLSRARDHEREADVLGARLVCQAGFDPAPGAAMFLAAGELASADFRAGRLGALLATHPSHLERARIIGLEARRCAQRQNLGSHRQTLASPDVRATFW